MNAPYFLASLTWPEAAHILSQRPVGLLPIGAVEAHGPHLPLDTDIIIANATADSAARKLDNQNIPSLVLPPISFTVSFAGTSFPGTSPVDADAFARYLTSLLTNFSTAGYCAIICCNSHLEPAHVNAVQAACAEAESVSGVPIRAPDQRHPRLAARLNAEFEAGARHAGSYETSIVMAARPDAVRTSELTSLPPVWIDLPARLREGAKTFLDAGATLGYYGNPSEATAAEGLRLLDVLSDMIVETYLEAADCAASL